MPEAPAAPAFNPSALGVLPCTLPWSKVLQLCFSSHSAPMETLLISCPSCSRTTPAALGSCQGTRSK